ncbi:hypothetical protein THERMOT_1735 [Bathymodiolus thermophilus thioautotrophic gill symbiont]|nr:hypothetical protein THERMOT_1735 [Bathymodiolus thermophilus thioautotrophic gill symbiont]
MIKWIVIMPLLKGSAETKDGVTYGVYSNVNATLKNYG